jgi:hypothetical protein
MTPWNVTIVANSSAKVAFKNGVTRRKTVLSNVLVSLEFVPALTFSKNSFKFCKLAVTTVESLFCSVKSKNMKNGAKKKNAQTSNAR